MEGNIKVIEAEESYKRITKNIIYDKEIDVVTLGVFVRIVSCSKDWNLNIKGLASVLGLSDRKTRECIVLLEKKGYLKRVAVKNENNKFVGWDYEIYNTPIDEELRSRAGKPMDFALLDKSKNGQVLNREEHNNKPIPNEKPNEIKRTINKEMKKESHLNFPYHSSEFMEWWNKVVQLKKWKQKDEHQLQYSLNKLAKVSEDDAIKALQETYESGWQGVFPKTTTNNGGYSSPKPATPPSPTNEPHWKQMGFRSREEYIEYSRKQYGDSSIK